MECYSFLESCQIENLLIINRGGWLILAFLDDWLDFVVTYVVLLIIGSLPLVTVITLI